MHACITILCKTTNAVDLTSLNTYLLVCAIIVSLRSITERYFCLILFPPAKIKVECVVPQHPARALYLQRISAARQTPGSSGNQWVFYRARNTTQSTAVCLQVQWGHDVTSGSLGHLGWVPHLLHSVPGENPASYWLYHTTVFRIDL